MKRIDSLPCPALEVRDLRLLIALLQAGTTKAAGALLHLAQPTVSRALVSLEDRLGERLFYRTPKGLLPTASCSQLVAGGTEILAQLCELERSARKDANRPTRVRLVSECYAAYHWLPTALQELKRELPSVELSLRLGATEDPIAALEAEEVDAALLTTPLEPSRTLMVKPLFGDEMVFVVASGHPLANRQRLTPQDLREHTLLSARSTPAEQRWFVASVFGRARPQLTVVWVPVTEAIADLVRAGQGIGILTEWVAKPYLQAGGMVAKRIASKPLKRPWRLAWRRSLGKTGPQLLRALKACEAKA